MLATIFWTCLFISLMYTVITILLGDILGHIFESWQALLPHHDLFRPVVIMSFLAAFGASGILLTRFSQLSTGWLLSFSIVIGLLLGSLAFIVYVIPAKNAESSIGFSIRDLIGKTGETLTPISAKGAGEVVIVMSHGYTNQIAESYHDTPILSSTTVIVRDVKNGILLVEPILEQKSLFGEERF